MVDQQSSSRLLGPAEIRELADAHGIMPTKKLGQNFVHDAGTVRKIVAKAGVTPGQVVLEVGPGLGSLTLGLLEARAIVEAVELDGGLARALPSTVAARGGDWASRLFVVNMDALDLRASDLPRAPSALVANLPYNVAVPILLTALANLPSLESALVMVQREVADRLVAPKGSKTYGAPTVKLAWYGQSSRVGIVGPNVFWPRPNVDSALVRTTVSSTSRGGTELRDATFALVDAAFEQRRKMVRASLRSLIPDGVELGRMFADAGISSEARPEALEIDDFVALARAWVQR